MDNIPPYQYESLRGPEEHRVFYLASGNDDDELLGYLETVTWSTTPAYEALSYVWGSDDRPHTLRLIVDDFKSLQTLSITQSLYNALREIRPMADYKRCLWIDAICINQDDNEEKSIQVRQMHHIYREASAVICYLCDFVESVKETILLIQALNKFSQEHKDKSELEVGMDLKKIDEVYPEDHKGWSGLRQLVSSPWTTRTWVLQEAIWAKRLILMAGQYKIEPRAFFSIAFNLSYLKLPSDIQRRIQTEENEYAGTIKSIIDLLVLKYNVRGTLGLSSEDDSMDRSQGKGVSLSDAIIQTRTTRCKDPRDKVYALMGVASGVGELDIEIDYAKSIPDVYKEVACQMLKAPGGMSILYHASGSKNFDLPSWVPDWSVTENLYPDTADDFQAGTSMPFIFGYTEDRSTLILECITIDSIRALTPFLPEGVLNFDYDALLPFLLKTLQFVALPEVESNYDDAVHAMGRALISNKMNENSGPGYNDYMKFLLTYMLHKEEPDKDKNVRIAIESVRSELFMEYWHFLRRADGHSYSNRVFLSGKARLGNTGSWAEPGDTIVVVYGTNVPLVVRPVTNMENITRWRLIGPCYMEGFMNGEAFEGGKPREGYDELRIALV